MYREEVAFTMGVLGEVRTALKYVLDGPDELKDRLIERIDEALHVMERPPEDKSADQRRKWREQKRRQRQGKAQQGDESSADMSTSVRADMSADVVVGVEEVEVEEVGPGEVRGARVEPDDPAGPPPMTELVDRVLGHFNEITGARLHTGPSRGKAHTRLIAARLADELPRVGDDPDRAVKRCRCVIEAKWRQWKDDPDMAHCVRIGTLFRPGHWDDYVEEGRRWWEEWGRHHELAATITPERAAELIALEDARIAEDRAAARAAAPPAPPEPAP